MFVLLITSHTVHRQTDIIHIQGTLMKKLLLLCLPFLLIASDISVQVLGSGGPETTQRASSSYLIKRDGKALVLIDFGGGSFLRFSQAKAKIEDLEAMLCTHLHIDHVVDLPALMKAGYFSERLRSLPLIGPDANDYFPGFNEYIQLQFGKNGAYRYMSDILSQESDSFSIIPYEVSAYTNFDFNGVKITAVPVKHGVVPTLAFRIDIDGKKIVFSADTAAHTDTLEKLSVDADILIAHHAIPQHGYNHARELHMTPERIAQIAAVAKPKILVLSHRMKRTYGSEKESTDIIKKDYTGKLIWAEDLLSINLP